MESNPVWSDVDRYAQTLLNLNDPHLDAALAGSETKGLLPIQISHMQGQLLHLLARAMGARRILEIGTLGGFSTIFLGRALPDDGQLISLELEPLHAAVARENIDRAGLDRRVNVIEGRALDTLERLWGESVEPFDFVFIDADKESYVDYCRAVLRLSRLGTLIVADNVVRDGEVVNADSEDTMVRGVRAYNQFVASEPRLRSTILQTVGSKGYDGLAISLVVA